MAISGIGSNYNHVYGSTYGSKNKEVTKGAETKDALSFFKEGYEKGLKSAQANARAIGARVVDYSESWSIDGTGNITMMASTTVTSDSSVKGWRELAEELEEKLKEKKEQSDVYRRSVDMKA